jgi:NitT/TauT family transport system ATP-binding protein
MFGTLVASRVRVWRWNEAMARVSTAVSLRSDDATVSSAIRDVITLDNVTKIFQTRQGEVHALDGIELSIRDKEFVCLIGPSGCGKSTILGIIAGLTKPSFGALKIDGKSIDVARQSHQIGLVFQDAVLLPWRTVYENVSLPLEVLKFPRSERPERIKMVVDLVGLTGFERRYPHELSGGMRQRLGIARALSFDPQVLLMDEPFGALDAITRDKMSIELLRIWEQQQKTVVFVTHSISEATLLSDRVVVLTPRPGRIAAIIDNPLPRPRPLHMRDSCEFVALSRQLRNLLETE